MPPESDSDSDSESESFEPTAAASLSHESDSSRIVFGSAETSESGSEDINQSTNDLSQDKQLGIQNYFLSAF